MSELMNISHEARSSRWRLLSSVSALALLASVYGTHEAEAAERDSDRPTVWIELGGQLERLTGQGDEFAPAFLAINPTPPGLKPISPLETERVPRFAYGAEGKVTFEPEGSNWVFTAALRYGSSSNDKHAHEQSFAKIPPAYPTIAAKYPNGGLSANYSDTFVKHKESLAVIDFQAGKDVGLGLLGRSGISVFSLGVRFAQLNSNADVKIKARPEVQFYPGFGGVLPLKYWRNYAFQGDSERSFHGIGPSLSWNGSAPLLGSADNGEISLDWGATGAVLFGRQKAHVQHRTTGRKRYQLKTNCCSHTGYVTSHYITRYKHSANINRARSVTVPDIGAFAGLSFRYAAARVSFGYRGDFFLGAVDGGIDTRKSTDLSFHGPFATISIGLGG